MVNIASYKFYFIGGVIIALTIVVGGDIPNFVFKVWVLALLFSLLTLIYYVNKLAYRFEIESTEIFAGQRVRIRYKLANLGSFIPANNITFSNTSDEKLRQSEFCEKIYIPANDYYEIKRDLHPKRRGFYKIGKVKVIAKDALGLFYVEKYFEQKDILTVYPNLIELKEFDIPPSDYFGEQTIASLISEDYTSIKRIRKYTQGDPLKKINQRLTAKMGEPYVNEYDSSSKPKLILLADAYTHSYDNDEYSIIEDTLVDTVASISHYALMNKIEVLYIDSTNKHPYFNARDMSSFMPLLKRLAGFEPEGNLPLEKFLLDEAISLSFNSSIVLLTPSLDLNKCRIITTLKKRGFDIMPIVFEASDAQEELKRNLRKDNIMPVTIRPKYKKVDDDEN